MSIMGSLSNRKLRRLKSATPAKCSASAQGNPSRARAVLSCLRSGLDLPIEWLADVGGMLQLAIS